MEVFAVTDTVAFEASMQRLRKAVREGIVDPRFGTLPVQARLFAERCLAFTPPRNKAQGETAVSRDLQRVFYPVSHTSFTDKGLRRIVQTDNRTAWAKVSPNLSASTGLRNTQAIGFDANRHRRLRNARGRVTGSKRNLGQVTLGPEGIKARAYAETRRRNVGWARDGWAAAIIGLGGKAPASWISRHGQRGGVLINGTNAPDPFIEVRNNTSWARSRRGEGNRIMHNALMARARDIERFAVNAAKVAAAKATTGLPTAA